MKEVQKRSLVKAVSWRFFATLTTIVIVYIATGELMLSLSVGAIEVIVKFILYYSHERVWNKINWGRTS